MTVRGVLSASRVMTLSLLRDRGAMLMAFLLPPVIFLTFAAVLAGASGDELRLHVGLGDAAGTATSSAPGRSMRAWCCAPISKPARGAAVRRPS